MMPSGTISVKERVPIPCTHEESPVDSTPMNTGFQRYRRHMIIPGFGEEGQARLADSHAVVMGCGGLGSNSATLLVRAGVGRVTVVDRDRVELDNLHRQVLYTEEDAKASRTKAETAAGRLGRANSAVDVVGVVADVDQGNVHGLVNGADVVLDGSDNFDMRFLVNQACVRQGIPWIHGAVLRAYGVQLNVLPGETACLRCLMESPPDPDSIPTGASAGVLSAAVSMVAAIQVAETLKLLTGNRGRLRKTLLSVDLWNNTRQEIEVARLTEGEGCPVCAQAPAR